MTDKNKITFKSFCKNIIYILQGKELSEEILERMFKIYKEEYHNKRILSYLEIENIYKEAI